MQIICCVSEKVYWWFQKRKTIYIYTYIYVRIYSIKKYTCIFLNRNILRSMFLDFFLDQGCAKEIMKTTEQWIHRKTH